MTNESTVGSRTTRLRLMPGVVLAILTCILRFVVAPFAPDVEIFGMQLTIVALFASVFGILAIAIWWLLFSRAPWADRVGALVLMVVALIGTKPLVHPSIAGGMMGNMLWVYGIFAVGLALVAGAVLGRNLPTGLRRTTLAITILLACTTLTLIRTGGVMGIQSDLHWRWTPTPEERLLAQANDEPAPPPPAPKPAETSAPAAPAPAVPAPSADAPKASAPAPALEKPATTPTVDEATEHVSDVARTKTAPEWPGFRGPSRDGVVHGVRIDTNWSAAPPVQLWRRPIGPGWSSFAVHGDRLYTQEQRGDDEIVACYDATTGKPVWMHRDRVRFWESNGGAGPRGTPTVSNGRVYAFGATGLLNALDEATGARVWSRNVATDTHKGVPGWGYASSPLVVDDIVIVAATGTLVGYDAATGKTRWFGPSHKGGYSSPHRVTLDGVDQIVLLTADGPISVSPKDGTLLWENKWDGVPIVQPAAVTDSDVLVSSADAMGGYGIRRLAIARQPSGWTVEERWTSRGLKPYFNDYVVHKDHAFGFDGSILSCVDLNDGERKWKGGRYGNGQLVLLPDQDLLLVMSEEGELALVSAMPDKFTELARMPALDAKTWNHPVLVGDVLLVRNGEEMAAFRLPLADHVIAPSDKR
jgi:outer membrane protein assembly factor BamB